MTAVWNSTATGLDALTVPVWIAQNASIATVALLLASLSFLYWEALPQPLSGIPYTSRSRWRFFGDALDFVKYNKDTGEGFRWFATKAAELESPIFQVFLAPFSRPIVVVTDIQEIIDMSTRRTREFDRGGFLSGWVGILFPEGTISMPSHDKFKDQRNIWSSTMTSQFLNAVSAPSIHDHTRNLIKLWTHKVSLADGRAFEVADDLKQVTIWTAATGDDLGLIRRRTKAALDGATFMPGSDGVATFRNPTDLPAIVDACETLVEHLKDMRNSLWLAATRIRVWMTPSWKKAWKIKEDTMTELIESSQAKFGEAQCAMDEVIKRSALLGSKEGRASSSYREMIDETFAYIVGGHETTQDTTKWSMKYLTANPEKQAKLHTALLELWPAANSNNLPSHEEIIAAEHPYVEASIQELIRISLTAPSWTRRTTQDVVILGHRVPAGIDVFGAPSVQSIEDMDDFQIEPAVRSATSRPRETGRWKRETKSAFMPERWLDANGRYDAYAGPMLPFGAGPRGCFGPGQRLARMELRIMIILLVLSFKLEGIPEAYTSFRAEEVINRGPHITYVRPVLRT
ncbi:cytochrome P450 [Xylariaceae sp. FL0804]|nr:cytochrome P450 [Xylariaceae sp. FL0804]